MCSFCHVPVIAWHFLSVKFSHYCDKSLKNEGFVLAQILRTQASRGRESVVVVYETANT